MQILVCMKQVPATTTVEVDETTGVLKRSGTQSKINPYDLYALEAAFALKEQHGGEVQLLSMGPPQAKAALHEALCMGADAATLLCDTRFAGADVLATARALAQGVLALGRFDLILCGMQTTDGDTAQVGPEMAELLDIPHASYVQRLGVANGCAEALVNLGDTLQLQRLPLPCLVTVEKDLNTPRLPSYRRSLLVKEEDIRCLSLEDLALQAEDSYGLLGSPTRVERIFPPPARGGQQVIQGTAGQVAARAAEILIQNKFV